MSGCSFLLKFQAQQHHDIHDGNPGWKPRSSGLKGKSVYSFPNTNTQDIDKF